MGFGPGVAVGHGLVLVAGHDGGGVDVNFFEGFVLGGWWRVFEELEVV